MSAPSDGASAALDARDAADGAAAALSAPDATDAPDAPPSGDATDAPDAPDAPPSGDATAARQQDSGVEPIQEQEQEQAQAQEHDHEHAHEHDQEHALDQRVNDGVDVSPVVDAVNAAERGPDGGKEQSLPSAPALASESLVDAPIGGVWSREAFERDAGLVVNRMKREFIVFLHIYNQHRIAFIVLVALSILSGAFIGIFSTMHSIDTVCSRRSSMHARAAETCAALRGDWRALVHHASDGGETGSGAECVPLVLDDPGSRAHLARLAGVLARHLCVQSELAPRLAPSASLAAQHVGERACVAVVRLAERPSAHWTETPAADAPGPLLVLANPRVVARSVETRVSAERDTLCRIDTATLFSRPRAITLRYDAVVSSGAAVVLERTLVDDDAVAAAHALDVLAALRVCAE